MAIGHEIYRQNLYDELSVTNAQNATMMCRLQRYERYTMSCRKKRYDELSARNYETTRLQDYKTT